MLAQLFDRFIAEGNSVLMVEHDLSLVRRADWVVDVGPGAGSDGGLVLYSGPVPGLSQVPESVTGEYLRRVPGIVPAAPKAEPELVLAAPAKKTRAKKAVGA